MSIRVFVGCAPNYDDAESQAVLEYTLRKNTDAEVEITWMRLSNNPESPFYGWDSSDWLTPFSGFRWSVPALCDYEGRAIYMDSDMIVMRDISELWGMSLDGYSFATKSLSRSCVMLMDCTKFDHILLKQIKKTDRHSLAACGQRHGAKFFPEGENWNCLDGEHYKDLNDSEIKIIHYTSMPHQPHLRYAILRLDALGLKHWFDGKITPHWRQDLIDLFDGELIAAEKAGFLPENYCQHELFGNINKGSVSSLQGKIPDWGKR